MTNLRWFDVVLALLVAAFAFLAASFAAGNSDLWLHLGAGRLLAQGQYVFGTDPFSYTTDGVYWANHAWLFDLALYAGHQTLGGAGLVLLKALVVTVLAGILLHLARPRPPHEGPFWISAACVLLAVLAMSPRLQLQPSCLSLLLLAVCLWLLRVGGRALYALPLVIALWVNLDNWFVLGPLVVGLYWLGQRLAPADAPRLPLWVLSASLAACLLSPHHLFALRLPAELTPAVWLSDFRHNSRFAALFASPWRWEPLSPAGGFNLAAWAFFLLLLLGLVSFAVARSAVRSWRFPIWLVFALLAIWQVRLVSFFAVVAGPIAALNFLDSTRQESALRRKRWAPLLVSLAALALIVLTWPGWLQGFHRRDRFLSWSIRPDPSLQRVAETLGRWREQGVLPANTRTFALHPDVSHYCAWFAPAERGFVDSRLSLFVPVASDYQRVCLAIAPSPRVQEVSSASDWDRPLVRHNVAGLVLYDPDLRRLSVALRQVVSSPETWEVLRVDGLAVVVGWKEAPGGPLAVAPLDAERAAFRTEEDEAFLPAPGRGPAELPRSRSFIDRYLQHTSGSSWETDAAAVYVRLFEEEAPRQAQRQHLPVLGRFAAGIVGLPALPIGGISAAVGVSAPLMFGDVFLPDLHEQPAALPLLAVRAARRALAEHPDDAGAWLVLAQAYLSLGRTTAEASADASFRLLGEVRSIQAVTALEQVVALRPDLAVAHEQLGRLYAERYYLDLALRHRSTELRLTRKAGPLTGEGRDAFAERVERLAQTVEQIRELVQTSENRFLVRSSSLAADPLARARLALDLGLAGKARDEVLILSRPELYGVEGLRLLLELLLRTGLAQEARLLLDRAEMRRNPDDLGLHDLLGSRADDIRRWGYGFPAHDWFDFCQLAAAGHHDAAEDALERLRERLKREADLFLPRAQAMLAQQVAIEVSVTAAPETLALRAFHRLQRDRVAEGVLLRQFLAVERADLHVLSGMLLLERGRPGRAGDEFRLALALYDRAADTVPARPGKPLALRYLKQLRRPGDKVTR